MIIDINNPDPKLLEEDDRISAYLKGKMTTEEESLFLKDLEDNPDLKERAIAAARLVKGLKEVGSERDGGIREALLASSEKGVESAAKSAVQQDVRAKAMAPKAERFSIRKVSAWLSVAACIALIAWIGIDYTSYRKTTGLGDEYDSVFPSGMISRGADASSEAEKRLEQLYADVRENANIDTAVHELSICWEVSNMETYNDYTDYSTEIGWYLAIAHLKDGDKKNAKTVLEKLIATQEESAVSKKAKELLEKL